jgi:hypothetical protein
VGIRGRGIFFIQLIDPGKQELQHCRRTENGAFFGMAKKE